MITKRFSADVTPIEGERAVMARITAAVMDRDGEVLLPAGMDAKDFEKNATVFFMHNYQRLPVGKCVAIKREDDAIIAKTVFADRPPTYPEQLEWLPDTLLSLYQQKVMNAFSIGFEPVEVRQPTKKDRETYGEDCQRVYSKYKLLEYSCVTIPANQDAVSLAVSKSYKPYADSLGIKDAEPEPQPAKEPEATPEPQQKAADPQPEPAPAIQPKRLLYVIEREPAPAPAPVAEQIAKAAQEQVAKRTGRIYVI